MVKKTASPTARPAPPDCAAVLARALALHQGGDLAAAAALYLGILEREPAHFDALHLLGVYALQSDDAAAACDLIGRALEIRPDDARAQANLGAALTKLGRHDDALACCRRALEIDPGHLAALNNCGSALLALHQPGQARGYFERALLIDPDAVDALNNLGHALLEQRRFADALVCLERVLELDAGHVAALFNRGNALQALNQPQRALPCYAAALRLAPAHVDANFNAGMCHLLTGDFAAGWPGYEWRLRKDNYLPRRRQLDAPAWLGQADLRGKTILLYAEQGLGDTIQFCRYVAPLAAMGATVLLQVQPALVPLLAGLAGAHRVFADGAPAPAHDYHCALMSLGLAFATTAATIPSPAAYLRADAGRCLAWRERLGPARRPRVGIVWRGNPAHDNDGQRSIALARFIRLAGPQAHFVALQKEFDAVERLMLARRPEIAHFGALQSDFAETAALLQQMDLVIAVDTSVAHLAAALGKPVWILLPFAPDWRWMRDRDDSPWYRSATLLRQDADGDWDGVLARAAARLAAWTASRPRAG